MAGTVTVSVVPFCVASARSAWPGHLTMEDATIFVPVSVKVKPVLPATAEVGLKVVSAGTGLLMVKTCALDVPPPGVGLKTVTFTVPNVAM